MKKRHRNSDHAPPVAKSSYLSASERLRPLWLGSVTALLVATPLIPSEAAPRGLGVSLLMAWFLLGAAFVVTSAIQRGLRVRVGPTGIAVLVFLTLHTLSALVLAHTGQPRQTLNMLWQWVGFGVAFFLVRQVVRTAQESRALVAVMIALAVCLSMHGYYQYFHSLPLARRDYLANPDVELAQAGIMAPPNSIERNQFENRLFSTEPTATFSLANSLAGFLAPWLLCAIGIAALNWSQKTLRRRLALSAGLTLSLIAGCFVLTKSRSATLALFIGLGALIVYGRRTGWRPGWKFIAILVCVFAGVVALAVSVGGLDLLVLTESSKSLLYRVQYWRATLAMIFESPWWGCGPGNFQQTYTAYKLPEASETITDPHNFLLEIWATSGTPATLAFLSIFVCFAIQMRDARTTLASAGPRNAEEDAGCVRAIYWGGLVGVPFGFIAGLVVDYVPDFALFVVALPVSAAVVVAWHPWVRDGRLPIVVLIVSLGVIFVNLSAAGGISFAGVALTLWLLLATGLNLVDESRVNQPLSVGNATAFAIAGVVVAMLFWYSTFAPVLNVSTLLAQANAAQSQGRPHEAEQALVAATAADSYSDEPWEALAQFRLAMWLDAGDASREADFAEAARQMLAHHRRSSAAHQLYGDWYLRAFRATDEQRFLEEAIAGYRRAVELYPNYNLGHAQLAWALQLAGRFAESSVEAEEALRLDSLNPHHEQKLAERAVFDWPQRVDSASRNPPDIDAEQLMRLLRSRRDG